MRDFIYEKEYLPIIWRTGYEVVIYVCRKTPDIIVPTIPFQIQDQISEIDDEKPLRDTSRTSRACFVVDASSKFVSKDQIN